MYRKPKQARQMTAELKKMKLESDAEKLFDTKSRFGKSISLAKLLRFSKVCLS